MDEHNGQIGKLAFGRTVKTRRGYRPGERERYETSLLQGVSVHSLQENARVR